MKRQPNRAHDFEAYTVRYQFQGANGYWREAEIVYMARGKCAADEVQQTFEREHPEWPFLGSVME